MIEISQSLMLLGFGLGLIHALDADHVMAVTMLAQQKPGEKRKRSVLDVARFCASWAIGHGGILLALTFLFLFAETQLPASVSLFAEKAVGVFLIGLGAWMIWHLYRRKVHLQVHEHEGVVHAHLTERGKKHSRHQPLLVGVTHGLAGSAPFLAIIPALDQSGIWTGLGYVITFCAGVVIAMMVFGVFLASLQNLILGIGQRIYNLMRWCIALLSIFLGSYWLFAAS